MYPAHPAKMRMEVQKFHVFSCEGIILWGNVKQIIFALIFTFYLQNSRSPKLLSLYFSDYSIKILCKFERKIKVHFFFLLAFLQNTCFVCNSVGSGSIEGAITSIFKHLKGHYSRIIFFLIFAEKFQATILEQNWSHKLKV